MKKITKLVESVEYKNKVDVVLEEFKKDLSDLTKKYYSLIEEGDDFQSMEANSYAIITMAKILKNETKKFEDSED